MIDSSPARASAAVSSAKRARASAPARPRISRHACCVGKPRAAADGPDDQVRQRDRGVEAAIVGGFQAGDADAASATQAASCPQAMKSAARPLA